MKRKTLLQLFIGISVFVAVYLFYVDWDRKQSIDKYFSAPKVGDVYKIKRDEEDGGNWLTYYKISAIHTDSIVFFTGLMMADASADLILNHFDTKKTTSFSITDLKDIRNGKWKKDSRNNTSLVEIVRK